MTVDDVGLSVMIGGVGFSVVVGANKESVGTNVGSSTDKVAAGVGPAGVCPLTTLADDPSSRRRRRRVGRPPWGQATAAADLGMRNCGWTVEGRRQMDCRNETHTRVAERRGTEFEAKESKATKSSSHTVPIGCQLFSCRCSCFLFCC